MDGSGLRDDNVDQRDLPFQCIARLSARRGRRRNQATGPADRGRRADEQDVGRATPVASAGT